MGAGNKALLISKLISLKEVGCWWSHAAILTDKAACCWSVYQITVILYLPHCTLVSEESQ